MTDGPIITLTDHSKFKSFQGLRSNYTQKFLTVSRFCTDHVYVYMFISGKNTYKNTKVQYIKYN